MGSEQLDGRSPIDTANFMEQTEPAARQDVGHRLQETVGVIHELQRLAEEKDSDGQYLLKPEAFPTLIGFELKEALRKIYQSQGMDYDSANAKVNRIADGRQ